MHGSAPYITWSLATHDPKFLFAFSYFFLRLSSLTARLLLLTSHHTPLPPPHHLLPTTNPIPSFAIPPPQGQSTSSSLALIPSSPSPPHARTHVLLHARYPAAKRLLTTSSFSRPSSPLSCRWPIAVARPVPDDGDLPPSSSSCHGLLPYTVLGGFRCPTYLHKFCNEQLDFLQLMNICPFVHVRCRSAAENCGEGRRAVGEGIAIDSIACLSHCHRPPPSPPTLWHCGRCHPSCQPHANLPPTLLLIHSREHK
jgi:hypothetical protein